MASFLSLTQGDSDVFVMIEHIETVSPGLGGTGAIVTLSSGRELLVDEGPSRVIAACLADALLESAGQA